jgi:hypothetical protein
MFESLRDYSNPNSLGSRFRRRRFRRVERLVRHVLDTRPECRIFDVGGTAVYWGLMAPELLSRCVITVSNLEQPVGGDPRRNVPEFGRFEFHYGDGRDLSDIASGAYDITHSNSVVEHVGSFADMRRFAGELVRIGRYYYMQTPNQWFPIEPHFGALFVHWLPLPLRARLLTWWGFGFLQKSPSLAAAYERVESINLIDTRGVRELLPAAMIRKERLLLLTKSIIAIGPGDAVDGFL